MVKAKSVIAQVTAANIICPMLTPKNSHNSEGQKDINTKYPVMSSESKTKVKLTKEQLKKLFKKLI